MSHKEHYQRFKTSWKSSYLKKNYGLTIEDLCELMEKQNNRCSICNIHFEEIGPKRTHLDHCHKSGKYRGILCNNCNQALGLLHDDIDTLKSAIKYLEFHHD